MVLNSAEPVLPVVVVSTSRASLPSRPDRWHLSLASLGNGILRLAKFAYLASVPRVSFVRVRYARREPLSRLVGH